MWKWMLLAVLLSIISPVFAAQETTLEPITVENAGQLQPLAMLERGRVLNVVWSAQHLLVSTTTGLWLYDDLTQPPRLIQAGTGIVRQIAVNEGRDWLVVEADRVQWTRLSDSHWLNVPFNGIPTFSADGTRMAVDNVIVNLTTGAAREINHPDVTFLPDQTVFSPDNQLLAARFACSQCTDSIDAINLFDTESGAWLATVPLPESLPQYEGRLNRIDRRALAFSPDSRTLTAAIASVNSPHTEGLSANLDLLDWDVQAVIASGTTEPLTIRALYQSTQDIVRALRFGPDGALLAVETSASSGAASKLTIYDAQTGDSLALYGEGRRATFQPPDNRALAYGVQDGALRFFNGDSADPVIELPGFSQTPDRSTLDNWIALHPAAPDALQRWQNILDAQPVVAPVENGYAPWVAFSPDGNYLARLSGASDAGKIVVEDARSREPLTSFEVGIGLSDFSHIAFSEDSRFVVVDSCERTYPSDVPFLAEVWDWQQDVVATIIEGRSLCVPVYVDDVSAVETVNPDGTILFWEPQATALAQSLFGDWSIFAYNVPGGVLAGSDLDGQLAVWNAETGEQIGIVGMLADEVAWLAFNENGTLLVTALPNGQGMMLWGIPGEARMVEGKLNSVPFVPPNDQMLPRSYQGIG